MAYTFKPYKQSDSVNQAQQALQQHQQNKPGEYQSQWQQQMTDLLQKYQNRKPFQYDINADAMYQQMVDRYVQQGQQAMMDTAGQAAALTGGYGNSYAQTAGQQTYQNYLQGVNDMLPQFYQMALDRHQEEGNQMLNQYNLMASQEDMEYSRYNDTLNRYLAELDRLQSVYNSERDYDYNKFINDENMQYKISRDNQELAQAQAEYLLSIGVQPDAALLDMAGYNNQYVSTRVQQAQAAAQAARQESYGGGGGNQAKSGGKMTNVQAALLAARASAQGASPTQIKTALKSAGLTSSQAAQAIQNAKKVTLEGNGGKFASRAPR